VPELRRDPVVGRWVIISTERSRRPSDFAAAPVHPKDTGPCVFCPGQESRTPEEVLAVREPQSLPNGPGWAVRVVPNKFPALRIEGDLEPAGEGVYDRMNGIGAHEVIIETPDHGASLAGLPPQHGIYGYLLGGLCYAAFGTSRQLAIGPTSAIALLVGVGVADMAGGDASRSVEIGALAAFVVGY
jgi:hypothetical protein